MAFEPITASAGGDVEETALRVGTSGREPAAVGGEADTAAGGEPEALFAGGQFPENTDVVARVGELCVGGKDGRQYTAVGREGQGTGPANSFEERDFHAGGQ